MAAATFRLCAHGLWGKMFLGRDVNTIGHSPGDRLPGRGGKCGYGSDKHESVTLAQIGQGYREAAVPLRRRLRELRQALKTARDPEEIFRLKRRIAELTPMLTECNALAALCEHYYERGYYRDERYTL